MKSPLRPSLPNAANAPAAWAGLHGSGRGLAVLEAAKAASGAVLVVARHAQALRELEEELRFYAAGSDVTVRAFPDWESLPYDIFSPHPDIISERLAALYELPQLGRGVILTAVSTLLHRLAPRQYVAARSFRLQTGERLDLGAFRAQLAQASYQAVSQVMEPGEFSVRGGLIDLFPVGTNKPLRLDLFDDRIESIRSFDPVTQRSAEPLKEVRLLPAREFPQTQEAIQHFRQRFRARFEGDPQRYAVYREVSEGLAPPGIEYYLPLFFEHTATLFDYLPPESLLILDDGVETAARQFLAETGERYRELAYDRSRALLAPPELFLELDELDSRLTAHARIQLLDFAPDRDGVGHVAYDCPPPPSLPVAHRAATPYHALFDFLRAYPGRVLVVAETLGRRETLRALLADHGAPPTDVRHWQEFLSGAVPLAITVGTLEKGLSLKEPAITVITEPMLYGERAAQRRRRERAARDPAAVLTSLTQLQPGDAVVHEDHGVGRYLGLVTLDVGESTGATSLSRGPRLDPISDGPSEFMALEYAGGDKLYLPVLSLHLISRYTGTDPANAPLHKLGGEAWEKARKRALEKAYDAAAEILEIHALRAARSGQAVPLRDEGYQAFADRFPFEETPDQARAINEVLSDMEAAKSMDRLVCGDVGFGKTEVAIRAAFLALHGGAQVALLVPTTLLAQQHYETFHERFTGLPYRIELLSRFRSKAEEKQVLAGLAEGTVHLVIGTHRLLQDDVRFKSLGLLILDEEHRFGVRQKEQLKKLRSEVDILTLTATPIPRTLNMALAGMRDISLIGEPPPGRLSVKTFVGEWNRGLIREAVLREIRRGGQVYYLHNEVRTIERVARELAEHLPEAQIRIAHGQMAERELEHIMLDFYHQRFNVLVCSTIIESGIDVPTANTIIIERADKLGLSQLHQLRGRVGRSHHRAYAYLLIPGWGAISADARKRLEAIAALEDLGAGFALASHDLEIRGAGELLGEAQSGAIDEVGFTLYAELLQRAVETLKRGGAVGTELAAPKGTEVNLHAPALLPEDYLPDVHLRLMLYKRIAAAETIEALEGLREEVIDRFGLLPEAAQRLFMATALKLRATPLGIRKIEAGPKGARIEFRDRPDIDPGVILRLLQSQPRLYRLDGPTRLRLTAELPDAEVRLKALNALLDALAVGLVEPPARVQGKA